MIERTYKEVAVVKELESYGITAGKFSDYLQALNEINKVLSEGIDEATDELADWCKYMDGYDARFKVVLDRAYEFYIPCLIARVSFWDNYIRPRLEVSNSTFLT